MVKFISALMLAMLAWPLAAQAKEPSPRVRTAAFIEVVAKRGADCGLMRPWQAAALRALNLSDMEGWETARREEVVAETRRRLAETACDNEALNVWINGSRAGFDREMLPPYLIAYRTVAGYEDPPKVFTHTALRLDYSGVIEQINAKLAEIEASGAIAEGGKSWSEYSDRTAAFVRGFVATLANENADPSEVADASAWIAQSALVTEMWLADEQDD